VDSEVSSGEALYRTVFEHAATGVAVVGLDGGFLEVNPYLCDLLGYPRERLLQLTSADVTHTDDLTREQAQMRRMLAGELSCCFMDKRYVRADGQVIWARLTVSLVDGCGGQPARFIAFVQDITARRLAEAALRESEARYRTLFETASDGIVYADPATGEFVEANSRFACMLGYEGHEIPGLAVTRIHPPKVLPWVLEQFNEMVAGRLQVVTDVPVLRRDGSVFHADITAQTLTLAGRTMLAGFFRDVSRRRREAERIRRLNRELEARVAERTRDLALARELAEQASRAKSAFLTRASHELRTPLNAILGFAQLLEAGLDGPSNAIHRGNAGEIVRAGYLLLSLIDDLLAFSSAQKGELSLNKIAFPLLPLVRECVGEMHQLARERGVAVDLLEADSRHEVHVLGDRVRLKDVLRQLLSNAVKASRAGGRVCVVPEEAGDSVRIRVSDSGSGVDPAQQAGLFQPFASSGAGPHGAEGLGIGLALVKALMALMDGDAGVDAVPGGGGSFWVRIPRPERKEGPFRVPGEGGMPGPVVWHMRDRCAGGQLIGRVLARRPMLRVRSTLVDAYDGLLQTREPPALVVLEVACAGVVPEGMMQTLRKIDGMERVPVLLITGIEDDGGERRYIDSGFAAVSPVPVDVARLLQQVDELLDAGS
jgi:PAS domain S-box-containing protein